ncbi:hypothetical protein [Bifidobacterium longum]|uniref:hypothetical protein n=1 Tax=Bifidobacterium longum TaxID=216816 RepID=UPI00117E501C|nr:hypothetical protein [Bifidobacterium longum]
MATQSGNTNGSGSGWGSASSWGSPAAPSGATGSSSGSPYTRNTSNGASGSGSGASSSSAGSSSTGGSPYSSGSASAWGTPAPSRGGGSTPSGSPSTGSSSASGSPYSSGSASAWGTPAPSQGGGTAPSGTPSPSSPSPSSPSGTPRPAARPAPVPPTAKPVSFISLGLGLVANLLIWPICWAVQTFFLKAVFGYVPDDWMMTPQKGLLYTFVGFCAFIVMYLTAKYAAVLANGIMVGKLVCYAMMAVIALLILSRLSGMGHTALVPTSYSNIFASFNMAFLPGLVMFVGALLCAAADNAVSSSRKKGIGLYVVATLVLLFASVEIAAMATSLSAALV